MLQVMASYLRGFTLIAGVIIANIVTWSVLRINQIYGKYPIDADSIGIPIAITIASSVAVSPFIILIGIFGRYIIVILFLSNRFFVRLFFVLLLIFSYALSFAFCFYLSIYWHSSGHFLISSTYIIIMMFLFFYFMLDVVYSVRRIYRSKQDRWGRSH